MSNKPTVSICIIAHNEEANLEDCLRSVVEQADQVVVLNAESSDATAEILATWAKEHENVMTLQAPNTLYYNVNKMKTFEAATSDWLFYLDADERFTPALWKELHATIASTDHAGFSVGRKNFYLGHWMRHGGMYPERQPRLFRRGKGRFALTHVHETLQIDGTLGEISEPFLHYSYTSVRQYLAKLDIYSSVQAEIWHKEGLRWSAGNTFKYAIVRPLGRFVQIYIAKLGFLDGLVGFFASWMAGLTEFVTYLKLYDAGVSLKSTPTNSASGKKING